MKFAIGPVIAAAQLVATITAADDAPGPCVIELYATAQPLTGAAPGGDPVAEIVLAKPCATFAAGALTLHLADPAGSLVLNSGIPLWARWRRSDMVLVSDCTVTDDNNDGGLTISGGVTPPGATSPQLLAGGIVLLGAVTLL